MARLQILFYLKTVMSSLKDNDMKKDAIEKLIKEAGKSMRKAIAPYSGFKVGVALETKRGEIYTGCNIENPSLMLSVCAEKVALMKALSEGEKSFRSMAIVSGSKEYCFPCGSCRQMLFEFAKDIDIFLYSKEGIKKYSLNELLPFAFTP
jgi:cytidine deaminase